MCGIAGIAGSLPEGRDRLPTMLRTLAHRGPDDRGEYYCAKGRVALGQQRLAILDLSPLGHQPMVSGCGRYVIVFNGEVYNFRDLRDDLLQSGVRLKSQSDTEVILELYAREGASCVRRLDGMFALAIWDTRDETLFCARDPLGIKPFYYWQVEDKFAFASEVRALLQSELAPRRLDFAALHGYLVYGAVQEPETLVAGIRSLPAGHTLTWSRNKTQLDSYWELKFDDPRPELQDYEQALLQTRRALDDSITRHFVSDVPVGIFLSGGIDSTAVLALAHAQGVAPLQTFCIGFEQRELDESDLAQRTADHFKTEHHSWRMSANEGMDLFHTFLDKFDLPSNDGFNSYCVSKFARDQGLKVVLSGLGGDELFGGYPSFNVIPKLQRIYALCGWGGGMRRVVAHSLSRLPFAPRHQRLLSFLRSKGQLIDAYCAMRGHFTPTEANSLLADFGATSESFEVTIDQPLPIDVRDGVAYLEATRYMRNQLLRDSDVLSMSVGLELRTPLVDRKLWDRVTRIPASARLQSGKKMLVDAVPEIPSWILGGPKRGFRFPFEQWLSGPWSDMFTSLERRASVPLRTWSRKWSVFVLNHFITSNQIS